MDFQAVPPPTQSYGAPNVFQQPQQQPAQGQQPGQPAQGAQQNSIQAMLAKAKQLLSSGQISADQYTQLASQYGGSQSGQLATMGGNMGSGMPGAAPSAQMNILPGAGG